MTLGIPASEDEEFCEQMIRQCAHIDLLQLIRNSTGISCYDLTEYDTVSTREPCTLLHKDLIMKVWRQVLFAITCG